MQQSRYLRAFQNLKETGNDTFQLIGDCLLVERIAEAEVKTKSGLVIATPSDHIRNSYNENKPLFARVILVGEGFYDSETGQDTPLDVGVGDIILVGQLSVQWFSTFGELDGYEHNTIGITRESEIKMRFKGEEGKQRAFQILSGSIEEKNTR